MKLIDQLALEGVFQVEINNITDADAAKCYRLGFENGFRKAKELLEPKELQGKDVDLDDSDWLEITISDLRKLGEEEVG